jgi:tetratricopeptide (TPR) repeat protein
MAEAAAALVLAALGGLMAVLFVQRRANADLTAKNNELADEQAKVQARFELARKAIATFHTGVSEDVLLRNEQFKELQTRLLREAAGFYGDLERLLEGQTDAKSRRLLAESHYQLGELTRKIGAQPEALAIHRKALASQRELAAANDADVEIQLDVARSLGAVGRLQRATGDTAGARASFEEQRDIAMTLEAESPTDPVRAELARSLDGIGAVLRETGKPNEALAAMRRALAIQQEPAEANPAALSFQSDLAQSLHNIALVLRETGRPDEALAAYRQARDIRQQLTDANPAVLSFQSDLATSHNNVGSMLSETGNLPEALKAWQQALAIRQHLVGLYPAVSEFQRNLANSHFNIGWLLSETGKPTEALAAWEKARDIRQKLADANPSVLDYQRCLAETLPFCWNRRAKPPRR